MAREEREAGVEASVLSQKDFEKWIFQGLKKPRIDRMERQEFEKMKAHRLDDICPTGRYVRLGDWSLDSIHGGKLLVVQDGRSNRYIPLDRFLTGAGLHPYEVTVYTSEESGSGHSCSTVTLRVWMQPGDKSMKVYATDLKETLGAHTGDILGGPNSMNYGFNHGHREVQVQASLLEDTHLAFISTSMLARMVRSLF